jgi:uncharacterized protein YqgC (DUF456 family)
MGTMISFILGWVLIGIGFLGCFINKVPGPVLAVLGLVVVALTGNIDVPWWGWAIIACLLVVGKIVDKKFLPKVATSVAEYGKAGTWGTTIGTFLGLLILAASASDSYSTVVTILMFLLPFVVLPYLFAFIFEMISRKSPAEGAKAACGAYVAYLVGSMLKCVVCLYSVSFFFDSI